MGKFPPHRERVVDNNIRVYQRKKGLNLLVLLVGTDTAKIDRFLIAPPTTECQVRAARPENNIAVDILDIEHFGVKEAVAGIQMRRNLSHGHWQHRDGGALMLLLGYQTLIAIDAKIDLFAGEIELQTFKLAAVFRRLFQAQHRRQQVRFNKTDIDIKAGQPNPFDLAKRRQLRFQFVD